MRAGTSASRCTTMGRGCRSRTNPSCSSRSSRRSPSERAPGSGCRSATASSNRSAGRSATWATTGAAPRSTSSCPSRNRQTTCRTPIPKRPMTHRLYYTDPYLAAFDAVVQRVEQTAERLTVTLDQTAFYPTSGGQPFDIGTLAGLQVVDVVDEDDGTISHVLDHGPGTDHGPRTDQAPSTLAQGLSVHGAIDWT